MALGSLKDKIWPAGVIPDNTVWEVYKGHVIPTVVLMVNLGSEEAQSLLLAHEAFAKFCSEEFVDKVEVIKYRGA